MRIILAIFFSLCVLGLRTAAGEENQPLADPSGVQKIELLLRGEADHAPALRSAMFQYLREIDEIDKRSAEAKAEAREKLLSALGKLPADPAAKGASTPGLIGTAIVNGEPSGIAFHYEHGKLFPRELIWERFHRASGGPDPQSSVSITLLGHVEVPREMTVKVSQAAGGVNGDHGTLFIGDRQLGQVGDDTAKAEVYVLTLPAGVHPVRWVLTGGTFQNNLLKFEDPNSGELLRVFYDDSQRRLSGAANAREGVEAAADPTEWLKAMGPAHWRWVPLGKP
jgi:hypothetical protein